MKIIVGLGNPGEQYNRTPHNAGFVALDCLIPLLQGMGYQVEPWHELKKEKSQISEVTKPEGKRVAVLVKPQTYMNLSGRAVQLISDKYGVRNPDDILIIYDELDIKLGGYKFSPIKNSREHKGILSIISTLGKTVQSLRLGVDHRVVRYTPGLEYVLKPYTQEEQVMLKEAAVKAIRMHVLPFLGLV